MCHMLESAQLYGGSEHDQQCTPEQLASWLVNSARQRMCSIFENLEFSVPKVNLMIDILVLGELNADLILRGDVVPEWNQTEKLIDDAALTLGSSSAIFACGAARLGLRVAFVGVVGDDLLGRFCREALDARGVDTSGVVVDPALRTGMTVILQLPDDRAMLTFPGAIPMLRAEMVDPALLQAARHIHVGSYFWQTALQPGLPALFAQARARGASTSLDTQWDPSGAWAGLDAVLAATDILLPNEAEACALAGTTDWRPALEALAGRVPTVAVKRGAAARRRCAARRSPRRPRRRCR